MTSKILIVEDNALNMKLFTGLLESQGYEVIQRIDADDIFDIVIETKPDLILMDIQLPTISGLDATRILKADDATRHIPVIAVTAFAMNGDKAKVLEAGCDAYLSKPIQVLPFLTKVIEMLGHRK